LAFKIISVLPFKTSNKNLDNYFNSGGGKDKIGD
jgi:hypothetical protein